MSQQADKLFEDAQALPDEERAILALQLLDSVGEPEPEIERAWRKEVRHRIEDIDAGSAKLSTWDEARKRIFAHERSRGTIRAGMSPARAWRFRRRAPAVSHSRNDFTAK